MSVSAVVPKDRLRRAAEQPSSVELPEHLLGLRLGGITPRCSPADDPCDHGGDLALRGARFAFGSRNVDRCAVVARTGKAT